MQRMSREPIDFPVIDIKVEKVDYPILAFICKRSNLKDCLLACEMMYETHAGFDNDNTANYDVDNEFFIIQEYQGEFYIVDRPNQIYNLTGGR